jgi:hypothetical protein
MLKGKFYYCKLPEELENSVKMDEIDTKYDCINFGG